MAKATNTAVKDIDDPDIAEPASPRPEGVEPFKPAAESTRATLPELPKKEFPDKKAISEYVQAHGYGQEQMSEMEVTDTERRAYERYRGAQRGRACSAMCYYVAALRMWHKGKMPVRPLDAPELNKMTIDK